MKLTCVTATFNCIASGNRETLIRCIESVAKLKTEHEHLVYDGASTDGTVELLRELESTTHGLKVISEPDTGIYNALNKGIRDAKGEWFYVLGADDYILIPKNMDRLLVEEADADLIATPAIRYEGIRPVVPSWIFMTGPYNHQGTVAKTSVLREFGGYDERYRRSADYDSYLKFHKTAKTIRYRKTVFAYYDGRGLSATDIEKTFEEEAMVSAAAFGTSVERAKWMRHGAWPPVGMLSHYLFHPDPTLREASRLAIKGCVWRVLRLVFWPLALLKRALKAILRAIVKIAR